MDKAPLNKRLNSVSMLRFASIETHECKMQDPRCKLALQDRTIFIKQLEKLPRPSKGTLKSKLLVDVWLGSVRCRKVKRGNGNK